ncbi:unnamed protein product [Prorocentrum cordatum]|uniref:Secreted protein n=1 Tax=Prorocentrum cordatum TaxID=2364126 RepID=A0ABN9V9T8_9DINO|nr:unnamed protein product [Polarella glacialis]
MWLITHIWLTRSRFHSCISIFEVNHVEYLLLCVILRPICRVQLPLHAEALCKSPVQVASPPKMNTSPHETPQALHAANRVSSRRRRKSRCTSTIPSICAAVFTKRRTKLTGSTIEREHNKLRIWRRPESIPHNIHIACY